VVQKYWEGEKKMWARLLKPCFLIIAKKWENLQEEYCIINTRIHIASIAFFSNQSGTQKKTKIGRIDSVWEEDI
jgi:hypothetical protein